MIGDEPNRVEYCVVLGKRSYTMLFIFLRREESEHAVRTWKLDGGEYRRIGA